jgi:hypothetical protein
MTSMETENRKFTITRVLMGQPYVIEQPDNIMIPATDVRVIVENGGIYQRTFLSFGLTPSSVRAAWDSDHEKFTKINPNQLATTSSSNP